MVAYTVSCVLHKKLRVPTSSEVWQYVNCVMMSVIYNLRRDYLSKRHYVVCVKAASEGSNHVIQIYTLSLVEWSTPKEYLLRGRPSKSGRVGYKSNYLCCESHVIRYTVPNQTQTGIDLYLTEDVCVCVCLNSTFEEKAKHSSGTGKYSTVLLCWTWHHWQGELDLPFHLPVQLCWPSLCLI